jgi:hypothetical protein
MPEDTHFRRRNRFDCISMRKSAIQSCIGFCSYFIYLHKGYKTTLIIAKCSGVNYLLYILSGSSVVTYQDFIIIIIISGSTVFVRTLTASHRRLVISFGTW